MLKKMPFKFGMTFKCVIWTIALNRTKNNTNFVLKLRIIWECLNKASLVDVLITKLIKLKSKSSTFKFNQNINLIIKPFISTYNL